MLRAGGKMLSRKFFGRFLAILMLVYVSLSALAGILAAELTLRPPRRPLRYAELARATAARNQATLADVSLATSDGVRLHGWFARPQKSNNNVVLLFHGVSDNREGAAGFAEMFLRRGYSVLMMDSRAHGESGGDIATYGLLETGDVRQWIDWLELTARPTCIFGLGESMGAAILLQSLRQEARFCAVAAESSYQNFREIAYDRGGQFTGTNTWIARTLGRPSIEAGVFYARLRYGIALSEVSPEQAVSGTRVPVLLIHGSNDVNTPPRHSVAIKARNPNRISLWIVPGAVHTGASSAAPEEFWRRVLEWFEIAGKRPPVSRG
jgi:alpha-beta hydrolase superfamily lysophospholipase